MRNAGPVYEYACHEGNRGMTNILQAARVGRQTPPAPAPDKPVIATQPAPPAKPK
jgi:hypothetical protein